MNDRFGKVARGAVAASESRRWPESRQFEGKPPINIRLKASDDGCKLPQPLLSNGPKPPSGGFRRF